MPTQKRFFFLNENIGQGLTGVESSAFLRARLFKKYLGYTPIFVTYRFNNSLRENQQKFIYSGILDADIPILNMFDFYTQRVEPAKEICNQSFIRQPDAEYQVVKKHLDYRVLRKGKISMYIKYNPKTRLISYINYFDEASKVFKRDFYDYDGYLSRICMMEPETGRYNTEIYIDREGRNRVIIHNNVKSREVEVVRILIMNERGLVTDIFSSLEEMVHDFVQKISKQYLDDELYFIVDRCKIYYDGLRRIENPNIHIIPIIHSRHTAGADVVNSTLNSNFEPVFANLLDPIVTPIVFTKEQKKDIEDRIGASKGLYVIPHSTHYNKKMISFEERDPYQITIVSRLHDEKQLDKAIDMFAIVHKKVPKAKLNIYGYGNIEKKLQEQIDKLELTEVVKLKGITNNPYDVFETSGLSLLTSHCEAFALVVMESLATGCPVVSFDIKYGPSSMIENGKNGYLVPLNDINMMAQKVIEVLTDSNKHKKMCKDAYDMAKIMYASEVAKLWKSMVEEISSERNL